MGRRPSARVKKKRKEKSAPTRIDQSVLKIDEWVRDAGQVGYENNAMLPKAYLNKVVFGC